MLRGIPVWKPYVNLHLLKLDNLSDITISILKPLNVVLRRKNTNPNDYVHCCVIGCHGNSLLHLV